MADRPILFSAPMVLAILAGRKTQTRRAVKVNADRYEGLLTGTVPQERDRLGTYCFFRDDEGRSVYVRCPYYGAPGDRLWVRETWRPTGVCHNQWVSVLYRADDALLERPYFQPKLAGQKWRPAIHMPRLACRLELEVVGVRVERLQDISEADAEAEGVDRIKAKVPLHRDAYRYLWNDINGHGGWERNPWVWVIEFQRTTAMALAA